MDLQQLYMTALRSAGLYFLLLVVVRLMGKRTIGNFSAFDLLVALMLGEVVDEIVYGDVTFLQGAVAIVVIASAKYFTAKLTFVSQLFSNLLEGRPTILVRNGEVIQKGLKAESINKNDLMAMLRLNEIEDLRVVKLAILEVDGKLSVIKEDWAEPVQKMDLQEMPFEKEIPEDKRTVSKASLGEAI